MNELTLKVIETIAKEIEVLAKTIMTNNGLDSTTTNDVKVTINSRSNSVVIEALFANYIDYLENGRMPKQGKMPPLDSLRDWALEHNIPTDNSTLYLIARAIWRDGHEGRPILATLSEEVKRKWDEEWSKQVFETICGDLTEYFK